jgi:hypothetical protein
MSLISAVYASAAAISEDRLAAYDVPTYGPAEWRISRDGSWVLRKTRQGYTSAACVTPATVDDCLDEIAAALAGEAVDEQGKAVPAPRISVYAIGVKLAPGQGGDKYARPTGDTWEPEALLAYIKRASSVHLVASRLRGRPPQVVICAYKPEAKAKAPVAPAAPAKPFGTIKRK